MHGKGKHTNWTKWSLARLLQTMAMNILQLPSKRMPHRASGRRSARAKLAFSRRTAAVLTNISTRIEGDGWSDVKLHGVSKTNCPTSWWNKAVMNSEFMVNIFTVGHIDKYLRDHLKRSMSCYSIAWIGCFCHAPRHVHRIHCSLTGRLIVTTLSCIWFYMILVKLLKFNEI